MKTNLRTVIKGQDHLLFAGVILLVFLALGVLIAWLGWWTVPVLLLGLLYVWSWKWGLVVSLAALWAFIML